MKSRIQLSVILKKTVMSRAGKIVLAVLENGIVRIFLKGSQRGITLGTADGIFTGIETIHRIIEIIFFPLLKKSGSLIPMPFGI